MQTVEIIELQTAAVVNKQALEECNRVLLDVAEKCAKLRSRAAVAPTYTAKLADEASVTFESFEELLHYSNRRDRRIIRLTAQTESRYRDVPLTVEMVFGGTHEAFSATVSGEEAEALRVKERCRNVAARIRVRYGWLYSSTTLANYIIALMVAFAAAGAAAGNMLGREEGSQAPWWTSIAMFAPVALIALGRGRAMLFPRVVFELGQEAERSAELKAIRKWILTALILGVPVAIGARILSARIGF